MAIAARGNAKTHQREQWRINQNNYWKRKRSMEERRVADIEALGKAIEQMKAQKRTLRQVEHPVDVVKALHKSFQAGVRQQHLPDEGDYVRIYGFSPALLELSDLEREEFDSMESLKLHWLWYHSQFRQFRLSMKTYECLKAGEHLIVNATGHLLMEVVSEEKRQGSKSQIIVCPVLQQFEFENGNQVVKRITSEVDLVGGVVNTHGQVDPERILDMLRRLSRDFLY
ncbi:hypothetical protein PHYBOEH_003729 [Phytophthora boehmeriae]|uniref:Uncharacterized protein n=1 Tax=Phytophthora boehmeriae TaxID=109152 RepID=A0A8T1V1G9_9STRA|nr:hypothetical protein PHYBOEH_003729 [Phytophthora boehmeriae]